MDSYRVEKDALGDVRVPADRLWGAQTQRSIDNFPIGIDRFRWGRPVIRAFGILKKCAALTNGALGELSADKVALIARASILSSSCRYNTTPGSSAPVRVPITNPSSAVKPIVVATLALACIAHIDAPLPRCATMTRPRAAAGSIEGSSPAMNSYESPWNP